MTDIARVKYLRQMAIVLKFSIPPTFKRYSSKRLIKLYNGVGAEWMPRMFRNVVTWIVRLLCDKAEAAVLIHDFEFTRESKSYYKFTKANLRLAYNCLRSRCLLVGICAAIICQLFGWSAYKAGREVLSNGTTP